MKKYLLFLISRLMSKVSMQGIGISGLSGQKTNSFKSFSRILIVFAITFVAVNLFCAGSALATTKRVTGVAYGAQSGTPAYGTGSTATYTIKIGRAHV